MQDLTRVVAAAGEGEALHRIRRTQALWYALGTVMQAPRFGWTPEQVGEWFFFLRRAGGVYRSWAAQWGHGNPWAVAHPYVRRLEVYTRVLGCTAEGWEVRVRYAPCLTGAGGAVRQVGMGAELRRLNRRYWRQVGEELGVSLSWHEDGEELSVRFARNGGGPVQSDSWQPAGPSLLLARARREVVRALSILTALGQHFDYPPERMGRNLAAWLGPEILLSQPPGESPAPLQSLQLLAAQLHLGLTDSVTLAEVDRGWCLQSPPVPPDELGFLEAHGVLPHQLGRLYHGLLDSLAAPMGLRVTCEVGRHTLVTWIMYRR